MPFLWWITSFDLSFLPNDFSITTLWIRRIFPLNLLRIYPLVSGFIFFFFLNHLGFFTFKIYFNPVGRILYLYLHRRLQYLGFPNLLFLFLPQKLLPHLQRKVIFYEPINKEIYCRGKPIDAGFAGGASIFLSRFLYPCSSLVSRNSSCSTSIYLATPVASWLAFIVFKLSSKSLTRLV